MLMRLTLIATLLGGAALADGMKSTVDDKDQLRQEGNYLKSLEGLEVKDSSDEVIGQVAQVLIDDNGQPVAYVLSIGGVLGMGEAEPVVPIDALTYDGTSYVSKMTKDQLENLPGWNRRAE